MADDSSGPVLYVVATPIGNLKDITFRAVEALKEVDVILAEDSRVTARLLAHYDIQKPLVSYHQHTTESKTGEILDMVRQGKKLALVSDAGTPGVNDPGGRLVERLLAEFSDIRITPLPGPNAAIAALSASGFPADRFIYLGFPPHKKGRQTFFKEVGQLKETVVFYESKHRILKALKELQDIAELGSRPLMVARELTKKFETIYRGTAPAVLAMLGTEPLGEFVVVIAPDRYGAKDHE